MSEVLPALGQIAALVLLLALTVPLLGRYLAHVYTSDRHLAPERVAYRVLRVDPDADQHWRSYAMSVLGFCLVGILVLFGFGRLQQHLPLSLGFPALPTEGAWNTAVSFVTNTNWQWYSGEAAIGHLMQMSGLTVQNFVSAGGRHGRRRRVRPRPRAHRERRPGRQLLRRPGAHRVPRAAADLAGGRLRARRPRRQSRTSPATRCMHTLTGGSQALTGGPVASQEAIKELGTNGGGFYNVNSAHPFENPTPFTNLLEIYLLLLIPFAMAWAFGLIVKDRRQGIAVVGVMALLLSIAVGLLTWAEMAAPGTAPQLAGGAMEGKETRFGEAASALFAAVHHRHVDRRRQLHARLAHRPRRWRRACST